MRKDTIKKCNPPLPLRYFIPDVEARAFSGRLYFYGSQDLCENHYCSQEYLVFSTADMSEFTCHGSAFSIYDSHNPGVSGFLYAPDCICKDGKYYLYYCLSDNTEGVAVADAPCGPFKNGKKIEGPSQIDPAVFIDGDGQAYYYWGQFSLKGAKLKADMARIEPQSVTDGLLTQERHFFHEGACIRKRGGIYYCVFADVSRGAKNNPYGGAPTCLGYATAEHPLGPFTYRGVIIDNAGCDPSSWNNHGSIECFNGQWYVFYHRATRNSVSMRRVCCEKIFFGQDGLIKEVPMTSHGAGDWLPCGGALTASLAARLGGTLYIGDGCGGKERLTNISDGDSVEYRTVKFGGNETYALITAAGKGKISVFADGEKIGRAETGNAGAAVYKCPVRTVKGLFNLTLAFDECEKLDFYQIRFLE
ncbi:MAG: family 43 glycosylhydrolase [Clostridiales bacterium]|jgi:hypothetical protein|nr:family 43 glycosylhydrolase [Clostridiales bacterium]